jgi:TonB-dependent starch-binding outer membrane protein SusC
VRHVRKISTLLALVALCATSVEAQQRRITGRVTAEGSGEPLAAASVTVSGTTLGAYTGEQGNFTILAPVTQVTLRVRRIGYQQKAVVVPAEQSEVNVTLERDVLQLETQVVTGAATSVSSVNAANDVTVVNTEQLNRVPSQTIDQALQGKVPGAIISTNSGAPGGGTQIQIRGTSTVLGNFSPLYVVDGVIVSNSTIRNGLNTITGASRAGSLGNFSSAQDQNVNRIADLNPNDIENIQILKGPSAASIYGSKGSNGVVVITTKQGRAGRPVVDVTQRLGANFLSNKYDLRCFNTVADWLDYEGLDPSDPADADDVAEQTAFFNENNAGCQDYQEQYYGNNKLNYQTIASVRGGTNTGTTYFLSGLIQHDNGLAENDFYNKQSLRINLGQTLGSRLTVRGSSELLHTLTQRGISGNDNAGISPLAAFSGTPGFVDLRRQEDGTFPRNPFNSGINPFQNADVIKTPDNVYRLIGSLTGQLSILALERQTLDFTMTGGIDAYNDQSKVISPSNTYFEQGNATPGTVLNSNANVRFANVTGTLAHRFTSTPFSATTSGGFRQERREEDITQVTARGFPFVGVTSIDQATQIFPLEEQELTKDLSFFIQEEFLTLNDRLLLTAGVNAERSSNNGDQEKFYGFPKFSASYRMPLLPRQVTELKLRAAYGRAGNFPTLGRFTFATTLLNEGITGARLSTIKGAANIRPEISSETEGGFDATFFNGRAALSATQFRKQVDELLLQASVAPSTGFTSQYINGGQLVTRGTEVKLDVTPFQDLRGFGWTSTTTYSSAKSRITQLPVAPFNPGVGSFGATFGNVWIEEGLSPTIIQAYVGCNIPLSATGTCSTVNRKLGFVGDANPDYQMGFSNDFTFRGFRVGTLVDWRKGGYAVNLTNNYFDGGLLADTAVGNERLRKLGAGIPVYVEPSGFVKLREVNLSFALPTMFNNALRMRANQAIRLELSGRNLYTWTDYTGLDPEVSNFSNQAIGRIQDVTPYPPYRSYFFSINTTF